MAGWKLTIAGCVQTMDLLGLVALLLGGAGGAATVVYTVYAMVRDRRAKRRGESGSSAAPAGNASAVATVVSAATGSQETRSAPSQTKYDVFVSYSHDDLERVRVLLLAPLKSAKLSVCMDYESLPLGKATLDVIRQGVMESNVTLLVLTPRFLQSKYTEYETIWTGDRPGGGGGRRFIPVLLEKCDIPFGISGLTRVDLTIESEREAQLAHLIAEIRAARASIAAQARGAYHTVPLPPAPHYAGYPHVLQEHFTGRIGWRKSLTDWLVADDQHPVLCMTAIGGMGKSVLAWVWSHLDVLGIQLPIAPDSPEASSAGRVSPESRPDGLLWYSFDRPDSSFGGFLDEALAYCSACEASPAQFPSTHAKADALVGLLRQRRFLVVMDGFERQLSGYAQLGGANVSDDSAPTGEETAGFRSCLDYRAELFLQWAAALPMASRLLLTSRNRPSCLDDVAGCQPAELDGMMEPGEAVAFFRAHGIQGHRAEIEQACEGYGYHPLAMALLAGAIRHDSRNPADIEAAERYSVTPDLKDKEQHHILEASYNALDNQKRVLLSSIAAFRGAVGYDAIAVLNICGTQGSLNSALQELIDRQLLRHDVQGRHYDLHPVVRDYAYERLDDKQGVHARLRDYFAGLPVGDMRKAGTLEELAPAIELYYHTARAGGQDESAQRRFPRFDKLLDELFFRFAAYGFCVQLLREFFPDGEGHLPRFLHGSDQCIALARLAGCHHFLGKPRRAWLIEQTHIAMCHAEPVRLDLPVVLVNSGGTLLQLGQLAAAEQNLCQASGLWDPHGEITARGVNSKELALVLLHKGDFEEAMLELDLAAEAFRRGDGWRDSMNAIGIVWAYRALASLLMSDGSLALQHATQARQVAQELVDKGRGVERDLVWAVWLHGSALLCIATAEWRRRAERLKEAESDLTEALARCRRINLIEVESDILLSWARWQRLKRNAGLARRDAEEALRIADRCEYRLKQADCHNLLAALSQQEGATEAAINHAQTAYERAWCDGPPHCYKPALDEAERLLKSLGAEPPRMS